MIIRKLLPLLLLAASAASATTFPDTAELKKAWRVVARKDGLPVLLSRIHDGDSISLALDWQGGRMASTRMEREDQISDGEFAALSDEYGGGAAWHEFDDGMSPSRTPRPYEGLQQQWALKGYGQETGWMGSGVHRGRYFLIFRAAPPVPLAKSDVPLALGSVSAFLDTSSKWLKIPCKDLDWWTGRDGTEGKSSPKDARKPPAPPVKASCYGSIEDSRLKARILRKKPLAIEVRLEEGESPTLKDIRRVVQTIPDAAQVEYSRDLSQILLAEAQIYMAKLGQALPGLFNWPSWQLQGTKEGQVDAARLLALVRSDGEPGDFLPALDLKGKKIRLAINLYYKGTLHLEAEDRP